MIPIVEFSEKEHRGEIKYGQGAAWTLKNRKKRQMTKPLLFKRKGISRPQVIRSARQVSPFSHLNILGPVNSSFFILKSVFYLLRKINICPAKNSLKDFMQHFT